MRACRRAYGAPARRSAGATCSLRGGSANHEVRKSLYGRQRRQRALLSVVGLALVVRICKLDFGLDIAGRRSQTRGSDRQLQGPTLRRTTAETPDIPFSTISGQVCYGGHDLRSVAHSAVSINIRKMSAISSILLHSQTWPYSLATLTSRYSTPR